jgi:hypothetical protein
MFRVGCEVVRRGYGRRGTGGCWNAGGTWELGPGVKGWEATVVLRRRRRDCPSAEISANLSSGSASSCSCLQISLSCMCSRLSRTPRQATCSALQNIMPIEPSKSGLKTLSSVRVHTAYDIMIRIYVGIATSRGLGARVVNYITELPDCLGIAAEQ